MAFNEVTGMEESTIGLCMAELMNITRVLSYNEMCGSPEPTFCFPSPQAYVESTPSHGRRLSELSPDEQKSNLLMT